MMTIDALTRREFFISAAALGAALLIPGCEHEPTSEEIEAQRLAAVKSRAESYVDSNPASYYVLTTPEEELSPSLTEGMESIISVLEARNLPYETMPYTQSVTTIMAGRKGDRQYLVNIMPEGMQGNVLRFVHYGTERVEIYLNPEAKKMSVTIAPHNYNPVVG